MEWQVPVQATKAAEGVANLCNNTQVKDVQVYLGFIFCFVFIGGGGAYALYEPEHSEDDTMGD